MFQEVRKIIRKVLGKSHPYYALCLFDLAHLYDSRDNYTKAETLYRQALEIIQKVFGMEHPHYAYGLGNLSELYRTKGDFQSAESFCRQALEIRRRVVGEKHPDDISSLNSLAILCIATGRTEEGFRYLSAAAAAKNEITRYVFSTGSDSQRLVYLENIQGEFHVFLSLVYTHYRHSPKPVRRAMDLILEEEVRCR